MKGEQKVVGLCAMWNGDIADDLATFFCKSEDLFLLCFYLWNGWSYASTGLYRYKLLQRGVIWVTYVTFLILEPLCVFEMAEAK